MPGAIQLHMGSPQAQVLLQLLHQWAMQPQQGAEDHAAALASRERRDVPRSVIQEVRENRLLIRGATIDNGLLDDISGIAVSGVPQEILPQCRKDLLFLVGKAMVKSTLDDVVAESMPHQALGICQYQVHQCRGVLVLDPMLEQPAVDPTAVLMPSPLQAVLFDLLHNKSCFRGRQHLDDFLKHVICVWRPHGLCNAIFQAGCDARLETAPCHFKCLLHHTAAGRLKGETANGAVVSKKRLHCRGRCAAAGAELHREFRR
mmetsp:Transcript_120118/g.383442  ORF Transcript_120118/g.383442 Transcript_120118/m.383442 type:complete len:260 (+) Transcript_120118:360-1139(+)